MKSVLNVVWEVVKIIFTLLGAFFAGGAEAVSERSRRATFHGWQDNLPSAENPRRDPNSWYYIGPTQDERK